jgi:hypothetical protein
MYVVCFGTILVKVGNVGSYKLCGVEIFPALMRVCQTVKKDLSYKT